METSAVSITYGGDVASDFLKTVLSTVTSPLPLDLLIGYGRSEVQGHIPYHIRGWELSPRERAAEDLVHLKRFRMFNEMFIVREFRLVLCADVPDHAAGYVMRTLKSIIEAGGTNGGLDYLPCEPLIISKMRYPRTRRTDTQVGAGRGPPLVTCAL